MLYLIYYSDGEHKTAHYAICTAFMALGMMLPGMMAEFDNRGDIIPGSFVEIYLLSYPMENVLSLPVSALTNEMGNFYVYRQLDEEGYQKQEVTLGANNGKEVQVLSGLTPGDRIVTRGAYQVKMASASAAIPGHTHEH